MENKEFNEIEAEKRKYGYLSQTVSALQWIMLKVKQCAYHDLVLQMSKEKGYNFRAKTKGVCDKRANVIYA